MLLNHYSILDVEPDATPGEIGRAYRRQAKRLHPDANPSGDTTREFQQLQDAYRILQDPRLRLAYDASRLAPPQPRPTFPEFGRRPDARPLHCRFCHKPTEQPRFAIYWSVVSNLVYAVRRPKMGMFCADCARKSALRASLVTSLFGWWSLPGMFLAPLAIYRNAAGGERPRGTDTMLLWTSALLFYNKGDGRTAKGLAKQVAAREDLCSSLARNMVLRLNHLQPHETGNLKDPWRSQRADRWKHAVLGLAVPAAAAAMILAGDIRIGPAAVALVDAGGTFASRVVQFAANPANAAPLFSR